MTPAANLEGHAFRVTSPSASASPTESLLVFSDVHLGSDLNDSGPSVPRSTAIDRDLAALLAHYRTTPPAGDRWRLVVAGDFIDFVGMSIDARAGDVLATEPTEAERSFGLGGAEDHVRLKLARAAERHADVFDELARFVGDGHAITLIHGNHDLEMHWESVKEDYCAMLAKPAASAEAREAICARIEFAPWFFHRDGLVFIEHGHQYDPFCATPYVLAPLSPRDRHRVLPSLSDTLLRYIVRRTPGMKEYGHENRGLVSYVAWGFGLGARGTARLSKRFVDAIALLRATAAAYGSELGREVRAEHERRLAELVRTSGLAEAKLRKALALHVVPLGATPRGVLASVMLDRLLLVLTMVALLGAVAVFHRSLGGNALVVAGALLALWAVLHVLVSRGRPDVDPAAVMGERAVDLAALFPSSFIVMGHTHIPMTRAAGASTYVNLGSWAEEEPEPGDDLTKVYRAARTHLVVHAKPGRNEAHLCEWRTGEGPREIDALVHAHADG